MTEFVFKSVPEFWQKEKDGIKPNTVRKMAADDPRNEISVGDRIKIVRTDAPYQFWRIVSDVTRWDDLTIISWIHRNER